MARPTKHPDDKRSELARARVTPAELEHVRQQAHLAGLDVSEYIRRRILGYEVPSAATRVVDPGLVTEVNRLALELSAIGNNANQLARASNSGRRAQLAWQDVVARINDLGNKVTDVLERLVLGDS